MEGVGFLLTGQRSSIPLIAVAPTSALLTCNEPLTCQPSSSEDTTVPSFLWCSSHHKECSGKKCVTSLLNVLQSVFPWDPSLNGLTILAESDRNKVISVCQQFLGEEEGATLKRTTWSCLNTSVQAASVTQHCQKAEKPVQIRRNQL